MTVETDPDDSTQDCTLGRGGGLVVSDVAYCSEDLSSNTTDC